jgi:IS5 family transposase
MNPRRPALTPTNFNRVAHKEIVSHSRAHVYTARSGRLLLKRVFGYTKVRYRGIVKNHQWHLTAFALVNLYMNRKRLASQGV